MTAGPFQLGLFAPKAQASGGYLCDGWQCSMAAIWRQGDCVVNDLAATSVDVAKAAIIFALEDGCLRWFPARLEGGRVAWDGGSSSVDAGYLPALSGRLEVEVWNSELYGVTCCRIRAWQGNTLMAVVMPCRD